MTEPRAPQQPEGGAHSVAGLLALHLLPGAAVVTCYLLLAPAVTSRGFPQAAALLLGFLCVGMPLQLAVLKRERWRLEWRTPIPPRLFAILFVGLCALAALTLALLPLSAVSDYLARRVLWWLPAAALPEPAGASAQGVPSRVLATLIAQLAIDGIANPIVEELYFRGFLLPRLARLGRSAPLVNAALFTFGHFWQPYNYVSIFVTVLPVTIVTWWRRNIYLQMALHCLANMIGASLALYAFLR